MYFFPSVYKNCAKMWHDYSLGFGTICLAAATIATKASTAAVAPITESSGATNKLHQDRREIFTVNFSFKT